MVDPGPGVRGLGLRPLACCLSWEVPPLSLLSGTPRGLPAGVEGERPGAPRVPLAPDLPLP